MPELNQLRVKIVSDDSSVFDTVENYINNLDLNDVWNGRVVVHRDSDFNSDLPCLVISIMFKAASLGKRTAAKDILTQFIENNISVIHQDKSVVEYIQSNHNTEGPCQSPVNLWGGGDI